MITDIKLSDCLDIFIGYDSRFPEPAHVLAYSLVKNFNYNFKIHYLDLDSLHREGLIYRKDIDKATTEFTYTRFLVPYLMNYEGIAVFLDNDILCLGIDYLDIFHILHETNDCTISCVKHRQEIKKDTKMYGCPQLSYPRKNWSSVMFLNCEKLKHWTLDYINNTPGIELQQFGNLPETEIFSLPGFWNQLDKNIEDRPSGFLHLTSGGPWFLEDPIEPTPMLQLNYFERNLWKSYYYEWASLLPLYCRPIKSRLSSTIGPIKYPTSA